MLVILIQVKRSFRSSYEENSLIFTVVEQRFSYIEVSDLDSKFEDAFVIHGFPNNLVDQIFILLEEKKDKKIREEENLALH